MEDDQLNLFYEVKDKVEDDSNTRVCRKCNERKMLTSFFFPVDSGSFQGYKHTCKECAASARADLSVLKRINKHKYPDEDYKCPICGEGLGGKRLRGNTSWSLDHCHKTLKYRGYICHNCNSGLGMLKDDINLLTKGIEWIRKSEGEE